MGDRIFLEIPLPPGSVYYWSPEMNGSFPLAVLEFEGRLLLVFIEHQVFTSLDSRSEQRVAGIRDIAFATKVLSIFSPAHPAPHYLDSHSSRRSKLAWR